MVREIQARVLLSPVRPQPDSWFGLSYSMNLYRGCQHQCIYCDSRSECYGIDDLADIQVKANAIELLRAELARKRRRGTIGTGSMNDPYMPVEARIGLTRRALEVIAEFSFPVHVMTKSDLVLRDAELLRQIARTYAAVSFTVTTADDDLARRVEPGASPPSRRFEAMAALSSQGIYTGVSMMPILPFIEDNEETVVRIVEQARDSGAQYILPGFGMTLRDRQRAYFYSKLDELFPGIRARYEQAYGSQYGCAAPTARRLDQVLVRLCQDYGIPRELTPYAGDSSCQLQLF